MNVKVVRSALGLAHLWIAASFGPHDFLSRIAFFNGFYLGLCQLIRRDLRHAILRGCGNTETDGKAEKARPKVRHRTLPKSHPVRTSAIHQVLSVPAPKPTNCRHSSPRRSQSFFVSVDW